MINFNFDLAALDHGEKVKKYIAEVIKQEGEIAFSEFMRLALYAPGLGYYAAGSAKIGDKADFITAPELGSLFAKVIAKQSHEILSSMRGGNILEFGAGTGALAEGVLTALEKNQALPECYFILEVSPDFRERQQKKLKRWGDRVVWLDGLPKHFSGVMLANEVLDAMPVDVLRWNHQEWEKAFVGFLNNEFVWQWKSADTQFSESLVFLEEYKKNWPSFYQTEVNPLLKGWFASLSESLSEGVVLLIDYGYTRKEYYYPDRNQGTLMCHCQHQAHTDPFIYCGLQDITAHVDFTAVIEAAHESGFDLAGFTTQANFLLNHQIESCLDLTGDPKKDYQEQQALKLLTLPQEMGEIFKVMALARNVDFELTGFLSGDRSYSL